MKLQDLMRRSSLYNREMDYHYLYQPDETYEAFEAERKRYCRISHNNVPTWMFSNPLAEQIIKTLEAWRLYTGLYPKDTEYYGSSKRDIRFLWYEAASVIELTDLGVYLEKYYKEAWRIYSDFSLGRNSEPVDALIGMKNAEDDFVCILVSHEKTDTVVTFRPSELLRWFTYLKIEERVKDGLKIPFASTIKTNNPDEGTIKGWFKIYYHAQELQDGFNLSKKSGVVYNTFNGVLNGRKFFKNLTYASMLKLSRTLHVGLNQFENIGIEKNNDL